MKGGWDESEENFQPRFRRVVKLVIVEADEVFRSSPSLPGWARVTTPGTSVVDDRR